VVDLNESFILLHEHRGRLLSLAELVGDEDGVVAAVLDSASRGAIAERGWDGPGDSGPPGWFSDSNVALERVAAHSTAIKHTHPKLAGHGQVVALKADDDDVVFRWNGTPVAILDDEPGSVYGFDGRHLGWFGDGTFSVDVP
jgi:hypothetical protein